MLVYWRVFHDDIPLVSQEYSNFSVYDWGLRYRNDIKYTQAIRNDHAYDNYIRNFYQI